MLVLERLFVRYWQSPESRTEGASMSVSKRLRYEVLRRDNHTCRYCGAAAPDVKLTVDHVVAVALGGEDKPENLVTACQPCNAGKSSSSADAALIGDVEQDALRWSRAMERAAEAQLHARDLAEVAIDNVRDNWLAVWVPVHLDPWVIEGPLINPDGFPLGQMEYDWGVDIDGTTVAYFNTEKSAMAYADGRREGFCPPMGEWRSAARSWVASGFTSLHYRPLMEMVRDERPRVAWESKWKYFAGCMWQTLKERQSIARDILTSDDGDV